MTHIMTSRTSLFSCTIFECGGLIARELIVEYVEYEFIIYSTDTFFFNFKGPAPMNKPVTTDER